MNQVRSSLPLMIHFDSNRTHCEATKPNIGYRRRGLKLSEVGKRVLTDVNGAPIFAQPSGCRIQQETEHRCACSSWITKLRPGRVYASCSRTTPTSRSPAKPKPESKPWN